MTGAGTVAAEIAHLRRHAHALTGNWARGDDFARSALQETARDVRSLMLASSPRVGLYRCFHRIWSRSDEPAATARGARCRESLLLASGEKFQPGQVAEILEVPMGMVQGLVRRARSEAQARRRKAVVVLTDAPEGDAATSAMLTQTPLRIAGVARTAGGALALARTTTPDLLIA
ncbi:MAG: hypothetical protein JNK88_02920, partial [Mangrovicoccus sp.]|nr:hypothetical protein [Mangrovicoccus sp.]